MRQGILGTNVLYNTKGEIFAIATGSDACTEHEVGCAGLQGALCDYRKFDNQDLIEGLRRHGEVTYPDFMQRNAISHPSKLTFRKSADGSQAVFGYSAYPANLDVSDRRLCSPVMGAWDESSFGFWVNDPKLTSKLEVFAKSAMEGDLLFAGAFIEKPETHGVILARRSMLRPEHIQRIKQSQARYEANLRLHARSELDAFDAWRYSQDIPIRDIGFLWPVWKDGVVDSDVRYALNPGYRINAVYYGPYRLEDIKAWMRDGCSGRLDPRRTFTDASSARREYV